jgi:predicted NBD/HSP70 family sugar kinase
VVVGPLSWPPSGMFMTALGQVLLAVETLVQRTIWSGVDEVANSSGRPSGWSRAIVLDLIRSEGVVSRVDLVTKSGLTAASITRIVSALLADGLVVETGFGESTGGKRPILLQLNAAARYAIGLLVDDLTFTYVVTDLAGTLVGRFVSPGLGGSDLIELVPRITDDLHELLRQSTISTSDIVGFGVAVSGSMATPGVLVPGIAQHEGRPAMPVQQVLEAATGWKTVIEHDSNCAAMGEFWAGRIPATDDFATVYMATGIGLSLMIKGSVYGGASANAGKLGHVVVDLEGPPCPCGSRGCLEILAAPSAVVRRALASDRVVSNLGLRGGLADVRADFSLIAEAASRGDAESTLLIEDSAGYLAVALVSVANLIDLDHLYLSGPGFAEAGRIYLRVIREALEQRAFMRVIHPIRVELSTSGTEAAALGAAAAALRRQLTSSGR